MQKNKAFTLIELLVVIAIIAVLMAILMPALNRVREQARFVACRSNTRSIGTAVLLYLQDNEYRMPDFHTHTANCNGYFWYGPGGNYLRTSDNRSYWGVAYIKYLKDVEVFACPSFKNFSQLVAQSPFPVHSGATAKDIEIAAYALNGWLSKENTVAIKRHSDVIVAHDHVEPRIENGNDMLFDPDGPSGSRTNLASYRPTPNTTPDPSSRPALYRGIFRHLRTSNKDWETGGRLNILWLDGHVSDLKETFGEEILKSYYDPLNKN